MINIRVQRGAHLTSGTVSVRGLGLVRSPVRVRTAPIRSPYGARTVFVRCPCGFRTVPGFFRSGNYRRSVIGSRAIFTALPLANSANQLGATVGCCLSPPHQSTPTRYANTPLEHKYQASRIFSKYRFLPVLTATEDRNVDCNDVLLELLS